MAKRPSGRSGPLVAANRIMLELLAMVEADRRVRAELVAGGELFDGYHPRMADVHARNALRLDEIVEQYGWPGKTMVGAEGADAAWMVLQHAIGMPTLLRKCLPLIRDAADRGEAMSFQAAYLEDRISVFERRPQRYGTQFDWDESGELSPLPLLDPAQVDSYRQSVGLGPLSDRIEEARRRAESEGETPPHDFEKRKRDAEDWARSVGWTKPGDDAQR